jgi:Metallo-peptidase family M12B Reprolysin-like/Cadherin-like/Secretion system C-terminal sorting domain/Proprotein convertase P-domain
MNKLLLSLRLGLTVFVGLAWSGVSNAQKYYEPVNSASAQFRSEGTRLQQEITVTDMQGLAARIAAAPLEFAGTVGQAPILVHFPLHDGANEAFEVWRVMTCEPAVYEKYPEIRTFAGRSQRNPDITLRGSITQRGLQVMIFDANRQITTIIPIVGSANYRVYRPFEFQEERAARPMNQHSCGVDHAEYDGSFTHLDQALPNVDERGPSASEVQLRTYRLVVSATRQFVEDHGGTKASAFAAITEYMNAVSGVYERDANVRFQLLASSEDVIFLTETPSFPDDANAAVYQQANPIVVNGFITPGAYDIGHVFSRRPQGEGLYGIASIASVCGTNKASGSSSGQLQGSTTYGLEFIFTTAHEMGHQHSATHTWNHCGDNEGGRSAESAFEPGSGTTLMSYVGLCGSDNVVSSEANADFMFHGGSIAQIRDFLSNQGGTCGTVTTDGNQHPEVSLDYEDGFFIPRGTPFELVGSATDDPAQTLTYCWESIQLGAYTPLQTQVGDSPVFRSYMPTDVPNRIFPKLSLLLNNQSSNVERLASYGRNYSFRFSVRDGHPTHPGISYKDVSFESVTEAGPFLVMSPNTTTDTLFAGTYTNITWDVAFSDLPPVNCQNVNIRLSTDGGQTWPITLASNVENDGIQSVLVPNQLTNSARIRVDAADNIFFDVSNANFKIVAPTEAGLTTGIDKNQEFICIPNNFSANIFSAGVQGFSNTVNVAVDNGNLPNGATVNLSKTTMPPGETSVLTVDLASVTESDTFDFTVLTWAVGADTVTYPVRLITRTNDFSAMALQLPADGSTSMGQSQILRWATASDAVSYDVQLATSPSFAPGTIVITKANVFVDSLKLTTLLEKDKAYYWRIRPNNICSPHPWTEPFFFSTLVENCQTAAAVDLPIVIPGGSVNTVESIINISGSQQVTDINVKRIKGFHGSFSDLQVSLRNPQGTEILLFKDRCAEFNGSFNFGLDDDAPTGFLCPPSNSGSTYVRPALNNPLSTFEGQTANGSWKLLVKDNVVGEGGTLEGFELDYCAGVEVQAPFIVNNNPLLVNTGNNSVIATTLLKADDANNTPPQLTFTILTPPQQGQLALENVGVLQAGSTFTQADIDNGLLRYFDFGNGGGQDMFRFTVSDGEGGYLGTPIFVIQPQGVGTQAQDNMPGVKIFPNPAMGQVWISTDRFLTEDLIVTLTDAAGRQVIQTVIAKGSNQVQLQTEGLARGLYFAELRNSQGVMTKKISLK